MKRRLLVALAGLVVLAGIGYGVHAWIYSIRHVTTDDAYVETIIVPLAAKVAGHVALMRVDDNQSVKAGDLLLRIDPRDYEAKRDQARAAVAVAAASFKAVISEAQLTRETTQAQGDEALAAITAEVAGSRSTALQAAREKERFRRLVQSGYVSQREYDQTEAGDAA